MEDQDEESSTELTVSSPGNSHSILSREEISDPRNILDVRSNKKNLQDFFPHFQTTRSVNKRNASVIENDDEIKRRRVDVTSFRGRDSGNSRYRSTFRDETWKIQSGCQSERMNRNYGNRRDVRGKINSRARRRQYFGRNSGARGKYMSFAYLEDLLKFDEETFVLKLSENMQGLKEFVDKVNLTGDSYVLIITLLKKIFYSRFPNSQQVLLQTILTVRFVDNLQKYLDNLPMQNKNQELGNEFFWKNTDEFWINLIEVSRRALQILPSYASNILPKIVSALQTCIPLFEKHKNLNVSDEIKKELDELANVLKTTVSQFGGRSAATATHSKAGKKFSFEEDEPPDDFRTISVYPDVVEILKGRSFVRPNIIDGPYKDVNHYLDVQFRLLREDFVNPLRSGVHSILFAENKRYESVRVHKRIRFLNQETINEYQCIRLRFNFSKRQFNCNYENSKKFMFGTLMCFTPDNFTTLKFARIVKRDREDLMKGELVVGFDSPQSDIRFDCDYLMIESCVYFEPYFHVLTALKNIYENEFAMKKYIVDVQTVNIPPKYLENHDMYNINERLFPIRDVMSINDNVYGFNDSQMRAFKTALTREFAIIQGPPGTGKTYLGLKIAKTLLDNSEIWWNSTPMLVICFTNHALDQFMEGLLDTTENIVRIGGQSKNEALKTLNLSMLRKKSTVDNTSYIIKNQLQIALKNLGTVTDEIKEIDQYIGVISFECFCDAVPGFREIFSQTNGSNFFLDWLLEGYQNQLYSRTRYQETANNNLTREIPCASNHGSENYYIDDNDNEIEYDGIVAEIFDKVKFCGSRWAVTLQDIDNIIVRLKCDLDEVEIAGNRMRPLFNSVVNYDIRCLVQWKQKYKYLQGRLKEVYSAMQNQQIRTDIDTSDLQRICHNDRWALYTFWLNSYKRHLQRRAIILTKEFRGSYKQYEEVQNLEDTHLLRGKKVVGMTTTSAARLRSVLKGLRSPIVIVEEAAEVLEAHIITALTEHCQHLILIGDHKQLKPSSADFAITRDYKLGVSLFERMVNNGIQCHTLDIQHRMRPEISKLICPTVYPDLKDHESVLKRPQILGIDSPIRFIDHTEPEDECEDNHTKKNSHEVRFSLALARHLILNGNNAEQITILVPYLGQMFAMFKERDGYGSIVENVRVAALDNYQGEENDIIILSLVRSNTINKIGFLSIENRVCVALSRAKNGLYIIGNMELLSNNSKIWREVKTTLEKLNALGPDLILRCQIHTNVTTSVSKGEDFQKISEGGCNQICNADLACGHSCRQLCHINDREHKNYQCLEHCKRTLCDKDENHKCPKSCYRKCGPCTYKVLKKLNCGHEVSLACYNYTCPVIVPTKLSCDHIVEKPCYADVNTFVCPMPCEVTVDPCGHSCIKACHNSNDPDHLKYECKKKCARPRLGCTMGTDPVDHLCPNLCYEPCVPCTIDIEKQRTKCSHVHMVPCSIDVDLIECEKPCTKQLRCGHKCRKLCCEPCESSSCRFEVLKVLKVCGHKIKTACNEEPDRARCQQPCPLKLPCGHSCTKKCSQVCTPRCRVLVDCEMQAACGHTIMQMKCSDMTSDLKKNDKKLLANCSYPCDAKLQCGHQCSGTCGECLQGRFHKRCSEKCGAILICNHECRFSCREACRPCDKPCNYRCVHSLCRKKCGDICTTCKEPCQRRCKHRKCQRYCSSLCSISPCTKPCSKSLPCGHACIGFCGDPCPPKCLICDRKELLETEMLFGYENKHSKFVLLADCKHVLESKGMEQWLKMDDDTSVIAVKVCPKCKTPIKTTLRYSDYTKRAIADVNKVKLKAAGSIEEINNTRQNLMKRIRTLQNQLKTSIWKLHLQKLAYRLGPTCQGRRQNINVIQLTAIAAKVQLLEQIATIFDTEKEMNTCPILQQEILAVLTRDVDYITNQEVKDVTRELGRLHRVIQYGKLRRHPIFALYITTNAETKQLTENIETNLRRIGPYSDDAKLKSSLEELKKILGSAQILTDMEKKQIVTAMGMTKGHWYKCPNGHVYAIGECGGATQISRCNECGERIGGLAKDDKRLLANCSHPCNVKLKCGHECSGTCGECLQGRFHKRCAQKCGVPLVCNHECEFPCREACRPCNKPCTYRCNHSACKKKCGEICTPCKEPCKRKCIHIQCSQLCGSVCDVPPCNEPCPNLLKCKHPCIGFCGDEPCPPKCLICDKQELLETEMLFGYENENSRFVFLLDCKHVIESEGMEQWLEMSDDSSAIGVKVCPKCKTPIKKTLRYSDHIKRAIADVNKVKIKAVGTPEEIVHTRRNLKQKIRTLHYQLKSPLWESHLNKLEKRLKPVRNDTRQNIDKIQLTAITLKLQVLEAFAEVCENPLELDFCQEYQQEICDALSRDVDYTTNQEVEDVMRELPRLLRAFQYERVKRSASFDHVSATVPEARELITKIQTNLSRLGPYSDDAILKSLLEQLNNIMGSQMLLNDIERGQIVAAMGMARGHWFKCPNGHVYAIGNCGGAVEDSKCNECGARIGGLRYALASNNTLATEMDGATRAAYPGMGLNI